VDVWSILIVLLSPALLPVSILFPFYWVGQCDLLRRTGSWVLHREFHSRWMSRLGKAAVAGMAVALLAFLLPGILPRTAEFLASGGFLLAVIPVVLDVALVMVCSPDRAHAQWKAKQSERE